jgi:predicted ester cyclase
VAGEQRDDEEDDVVVAGVRSWPADATAAVCHKPAADLVWSLISGIWRQNMMPTAESEGNKATYRRLIDAGNANDAEVMSKAFEELIEPDAVIPTPRSTAGAPPLAHDVTGASAAKEVFAILRRAYPDLHVAIEDLIAEGDKVVGRRVVTGTHQGEYMGIPPTGKAVTYNEIFILRFVNGRVAEAWGVVDVLAQMRQLGVIPALERSGGE